MLVLTRLVVRRRERRVREHKEQEEKTEVEISENEIHSQLISPVAVIIDSCVSVSVNPDSQLSVSLDSDNRVEKLEMFKAPSADELSHPSSSCALFSDSSSDSASDCEYPYKAAYPDAPSELIFCFLHDTSDEELVSPQSSNSVSLEEVEEFVSPQSSNSVSLEEVVPHTLSASPFIISSNAHKYPSYSSHDCPWSAPCKQCDEHKYSDLPMVKQEMENNEKVHLQASEASESDEEASKACEKSDKEKLCPSDSLQKVVSHLDVIREKLAVYKYHKPSLNSNPVSSPVQPDWCGYCGSKENVEYHRSAPDQYGFRVFCKIGDCYTQYGVFVYSKGRNMTYGIPTCFMRERIYQKKYKTSIRRRLNKKGELQDLTCDYCGVTNSGVMTNVYLPQCYKDRNFCKNDVCCKEYTSFKQNVKRIPHAWLINKDQKQFSSFV